MSLARVARIAAPVVSVVACGAPPEPPAHPAKDVQVIREEHAPDKLVARGREFQQLGDLVRAEQYYAAALNAGGKAEEILPMLLKVCIDATRYEAAIEYAEPYLRHHPSDYRLRMLVASLYAAIGQAARAKDHYERVLEDHPDEDTAQFAFAVLLRDQLGDRAGADVHFREYLRLRPDGPHADEARSSLLKTVVVPAASVFTPPTPTPTPVNGPKKIERAPSSGSGSQP